jgi:pimeloyl-ACP methyl ester carboxylesterase
MAVDKFRASDGVGLAYYIDDYTDPWWQADTLLLLHAAVGHAKRFYAWVPGLCRHYRVVRLDLRGHGESEVPPASSPLDMDRLVADVAELLDHLGVKSCHIVGNSAGGYIAQNLAMKSPDKVKSLMLFGSTAGLKNSQAASWLPRIAKEGLRGFFAATIADRLPLDQVPKGLPGWFIDEAAKNDPAWIATDLLSQAVLWVVQAILPCQRACADPRHESSRSSQDHGFLGSAGEVSAIG